MQEQMELVTYKEQIANTLLWHINYSYEVSNPLFRSRSVKKTAKIFNLLEIEALIEKLRTLRLPKKTDDIEYEQEYLEKYSARFVVVANIDNSKLEALFALEGTVSRIIPAHDEMSNQACYAAGNIIFNKSYTKIIGLSNKTGHYKCDIGCVILLFSLLLQINPEMLADEIYIEKWASVSEDIDKQTTTNFTKEELSDICKQRGIEKIPSQQSYSGTTTPTKKRNRLDTSLLSQHSYFNHGDAENSSPNLDTTPRTKA